MHRKLLIILCYTVYVYAGILGTDFSPASDVSYSSFSLGSAKTKTVETPIVQKTITQDIVYESPELSPIYESVLNTQENKYNGYDLEQRIFSKSFNTENSRINKFEAQSSQNGLPVNREAIYHGSYSQESATPVVYASAPLKSSATHAVIRPLAAISEPPPTYSIGASPITYSSKVTPGLSAYGSSSINNGPLLVKSDLSSVEQLKSVTYSDTPDVSQVTFSGSKASYSW